MESKCPDCGGLDGLHRAKCPGLIMNNRDGLETLQSFAKMQPEEIDQIFRATCPQCDEKVWVFTQAVGTLASEGIVDPDCRVCINCRYVHWLRGPNESAVIPLPHHDRPEMPKKDRVRALVFALIGSPRPLMVNGKNADGNQMIIVAKALDDEIESIK